MNDRDSLLAHVVRIVSAHVSNNATPADQLPGLIQRVHAALDGTRRVEEAAPAAPEPAVPVRRSVTPEYIVCLECGRQLRTLKRHLGTEHGLDPATYRARWGLAADYPMTAPAYSAKRSEMARSIGLGRAPMPEPPPPPPPEPRRRRTRKAAEAPAAE